MQRATLVTVRLLLIGCVALFGGVARAEQRKDAAATVPEGSVSHWLDYYKRERGFSAGEPKPGRPSAENDKHQDALPPKTIPSASEPAPVR